MRTLLLNPPSYDDFDGGAGSRYQAKREVWSFWYPTWLAYPAGMLPGARLLDAPPERLTVEDVVQVARDYDHVVIHTSTPSFRADVRTAEVLKAAKPDTVIGFVGGHVTARPEESLRYAGVIDYIAHKEFDLAVVAVAEGRPLDALARTIPLVAEKTTRDARATAYVCERRVCQRPTNDPDTFARELDRITPLS